MYKDDVATPKHGMYTYHRYHLCTNKIYIYTQNQ